MPPSAPAFSAGKDHLVEERHQPLSIRLMQEIAERAPQIQVSAGRKSGGDGTGIGIALDRCRASDLIGSRARASDVFTSKSGMSRTNFSAAETGKRCRVAPCATLNPPNSAGAALSGCPSSSAQSRKIFSRDKGVSASAFNPWITPSRTVTLLPNPRETGTSPSILNEKGKTPHLARAKKSSAAAQTMGWTGLRPPRRIVTSL